MGKGKAIQRWYPSKGDFPEERQFNVVRQLTDLLYSAHDQIASLRAETSSLRGSLSSHHQRIVSTEQAGGPSTTKITGLYVKGAPPADGQTLKFNAKTGQIEWS